MKNIKIAVIGLGYVGLPLATLFSTKFETIGFDINRSRVERLNAAHDDTLEVDNEKLAYVIKIMLSDVHLILTTYETITSML